MNRIILSPSILAADFANLGDAVGRVEKAGAKWIHIDVMDGMFVPSLSFGFPVIESLRPLSNLFFDVHLMIEKPSRYIERFAKSGADSITFHVEAKDDPASVIRQIHGAGCKAGLAINPETEVSCIEPLIREVDMILIMSVHPGFGGQSYIASSTEKIHSVRRMIEDQKLCIRLEVDGGLYPDNVREVLSAGADVIVAGSSVFKGDIEENVSRFQSVFNGWPEQ